MVLAKVLVGRRGAAVARKASEFSAFFHLLLAAAAFCSSACAEAKVSEGSGMRTGCEVKSSVS